MGIFNRQNRVDEATKWFKNRIKPSNKNKNTGEGFEDINLSSESLVDTLKSFNLFHDSLSNRNYSDELNKLKTYREMASTPEISDVIEDAINESTQEDEDGYVIHLNITDENIRKNENKSKTLNEEFEELFYNRLKIKTNIWDYLYTYYVDGKTYLERVGKNKVGITGLKRLPTETMNFKLDKNSNPEFYIQSLKRNFTFPETFEEAEKDKDIIVFYPQQISYINSGRYGKNKKDVLGYLDKCYQPYNQLKLLETAVIIYRIIRAPERLVFRIDTGNMPKDKAMKYVEKLKKKFKQEESYDPNTGEISNQAAITSLLNNYFIPQSADGRGSDIDTIGGNVGGFAELDDIHYFQKKLYRSLKYPMSRVVQMHEGNNSDILVGGGRMGEITRDEVKWAKFLERQQNRFADDLREIFLLHLEFKGIKKQYELDRSCFKIRFNPPNWYTEELQQMSMEQRMDNYQNLANNEEFPKTWLMGKYLKMTDEEIKNMAKYFKMDDELLPEDEGF